MQSSCYRVGISYFHLFPLFTSQNMNCPGSQFDILLTYFALEELVLVNHMLKAVTFPFKRLVTLEAAILFRHGTLKSNYSS